jgi:hypothetical protein
MVFEWWMTPYDTLTWGRSDPIMVEAYWLPAVEGNQVISKSW